MRRPRVLVPDAAPGQVVELDPRDAHHLGRVLRRRVGDEVEALSAGGHAFRAFVEELLPGDAAAGGPRLRLRIAERLERPPPPILPWTVGVGLVKGSAMDIAVRFASELGLEELVPVLCDRSIVREAKAGRRSRWERIAQEAAKQCGRGSALLVSEPSPIETALAQAGDRARWIALPGAPPPATESLRRPGGLAPALFLVGPEGGFTTREIRVALEGGARPLGFPTPVLRTPTAVALLGALGAWCAPEGVPEPTDAGGRGGATTPEDSC